MRVNGIMPDQVNSRSPSGAPLPLPPSRASSLARVKGVPANPSGSVRVSMDLTTSPDPGSKADATELHRYAEALLVSLAADGSAPSLPPGVTDVPGYWLAPAVEALVLIMSGQDALEPLALAAEL